MKIETKGRTIQMREGTTKVSGERLEDFAEYVVKLIEQGNTERDELAIRWRQNRADYDNEPIPFVSKIIKGSQDIPQPFAQPRADALSDFVINSLVSQTPMVKCQVSETDPLVNIQEARSKTMDFMFRVSNIAEVLKSVAPSVWCTNHGILRMTYGGPTMPLKWEAIKPEDFVCVGAGAYTIQNARLVGHRFFRSRSEIESLIEQGVYSKDADIENFSPSLVNSKPNDAVHETPNAATRGEDLIELWQVYVISDLAKWNDSEDRPEASSDETRFSVVIEPNSREILRIDEYPYMTVCYFSFGYKPAPEVGFWHERSVAADMQGPHRAYNCLGNLATYGTGFTAFPPMVAQRGAFSRDQTYGMGEFVNMEAGDLSVPQLRFDLNSLQAELARIERLGDSVARISSAGIAQQYTKRMTATEVGSIEAGQQAGVSAYLETFAAPMQEMCVHAEEILESRFMEWKGNFMDNCPVESPMDFDLPAIWDIPGKMPNLNPTFVIQNIGVIMNIVSQVTAMAQGMGPYAFQFGAELLETALNAMDFQNTRSLLEPLRAMGNANNQQGLVPHPGIGAGMEAPVPGAGMEAPGAFAEVGGYGPLG